MLENAGIITSEVSGCRMLRKVDVSKLKEAESWMAARALKWEGRLRALATHLDRTAEIKNNDGPLRKQAIEQDF